MNHIVIIGFMGSGKTRVGKRLAKDFDIPFVDIDRVVTVLPCSGNHSSKSPDRGSGAEGDLPWFRSSYAGAE